MIIRESKTHFIMITQHDHAQLSKMMAEHWKSSLFPGEQWRKSVELAIGQHDCGWQPFDKQPFWNDNKNKPYTFLDFPIAAKAVLYKHGIDTVEKQDLYAALLCSSHYCKFMNDANNPDAKQFVEEEKKRQQQCIQQIKYFNHKLFSSHLALLQFCDNLSLYVCLHERGAAENDEHPFFKDGIALPQVLQINNLTRMTVYWNNQDGMILHPFPFEKPVPFSLPYKKLAKETVAKIGLVNAYEQASYERTTLTLVTK